MLIINHPNTTSYIFHAIIRSLVHITHANTQTYLLVSYSRGIIKAMHTINHLTAKETWPLLAHSLRRDADLPDAANSRLSEMRYRGLHVFSLRRDAQRGVFHDFSLKRDAQRGSFTISRSGEAFSPERDYASLKTKKGRLGEFSWQGGSLVLSPRRDKLAWAKIAEFATAQPHAMAEPARIHTQTHMQLHFSQ